MTLKNTFVIRFYTSPPHPVGFGTTFLFSPLTTSTKLIKLTGKASLEGWGEGRKGSQGCFRMEMRQLRGSFPPLTSLCASTTALFEGANPRPGKTGGALGERPLLGRGGGDGGRKAEQEGGPRRRGGTAANLSQSAAGSRLGPCCPEPGNPVANGFPLSVGPARPLRRILGGAGGGVLSPALTGLLRRPCSREGKGRGSSTTGRGKIRAERGGKERATKDKSSERRKRKEQEGGSRTAAQQQGFPSLRQNGGQQSP